MKRSYSLKSRLSCCLTSVTAVPIPRTTMPVSPSRSKFCLYLKEKKVLNHLANMMAYDKLLPNHSIGPELQGHEAYFALNRAGQFHKQRLTGLIGGSGCPYFVNPLIFGIIIDD